MCDGCGLDYKEVEVEIITNTKTITLCRNCLAQAITSHTLEIDEGCYVSELSGRKGAVMIRTMSSIFCVTKDEAWRLLSKGLMPVEVWILWEKHGRDNYEVHSDYYDDEGKALQPYLPEEYYNELFEEYRRVQELLAQMTGGQ